MGTTIYGVVPAPTTKEVVTGKSNTFYGLNYPSTILPGKGYFHKTTGIQLLKNNLQQLIRTEKGERVMLPEYGMSLQKFLFQPLDRDLVENIKEEVIVQVTRWLPFLTITKFRVFEENSVNIYGGHGLRLELDVVATDLNNTIFTVGASVI